MSNPEYICEGYYHDVNNNGEYDATTDVIVVDENGNIKVNTTYFTSQSNVAIRAKWEPNIP